MKWEAQVGIARKPGNISIIFLLKMCFILFKFQGYPQIYFLFYLQNHKN